MARLYGILSIIGWAFVPVFFAWVWWRMKRIKAAGGRGFEVVKEDEER